MENPSPHGEKLLVDARIEPEHCADNAEGGIPLDYSGRVKSLTQNPLFAGKGNVTGVPDGGFPYNAAAYRSPEVVGTLWIAPILDEGGIMHEARFVHFVIQEGHWRQ